VVPIKAKSDVFLAFKTFKAYAENQSERKLKTLRDDKGGEYMSNEFLEFTNSCGIVRQHTVRNRPQQNGVAERANRLLSERMTAMLDESGLPKAFWGECLAALVHVWNRCPTDAVEGATPYELWHQRKPDVSHLRVWGCTAYVHIQRDKREALGSHMEKCVFIGYPEGYKGWKFYNPTTKKTVIAERADFDERYFPLSKRPTSPTISPSDHPDVIPVPPEAVVPAPTRPRAPAPPPKYIPPHRRLDSSQYIPPDSDTDSDDESNPDENLDHGGVGVPSAAPAPAPAITVAPAVPIPDPAPRPPSPIGIGARLPRRTRQAPREWWKLSPAQLTDAVDDETEDADFAEGFEVAYSAGSAEPLSYGEALRHSDAEQWRQAAVEELNAHSSNGTWKLVPRPVGHKVIGSKWVFKVKRNADGSIERYKGRLVAKGYNQRPGFDYVEIFAPTVRMPTIRVVLAIAAIHDLHLRSINISHAYLNGEV
jgi:hypothetical protein